MYLLCAFIQILQLLNKHLTQIYYNITTHVAHSYDQALIHCAQFKMQPEI